MSELGPDARSLIAEARGGDDPSAADYERVRVKLAAALAAGSTLAATGTASASAGGHAASGSAGLLLSAKIGAAVLVVAAVSAAVVLRTRGPAAPPGGAHSPGSALEAATSDPSHHEAASASAPRAREPADERAARLDARSGVRDTGVIGAAPGATVPRAHAASSEPEARAERPAQRAGAGRTTSAGQGLQRAPRGGSIDTLSLPEADEEPMLSVPVEALAPSLRAELELIAAAQRAVRQGEPVRALTIVDEHAARFPRGVLVQERLAIAALSWCKRGDARRGARYVAQLERRAPASPLLARARAACQKVAAE